MNSVEEDPSHQLHLRYHDLNKADCNPARPYLPPVNPNTNLTEQNNPSPSIDELQLQSVKLPLKLPQRRKFITLAEANSASFGLNFHVNLENLASLGSSAFQKALDLAMTESQEEALKQVELPAMAESKEEGYYEAADIGNTKKKLLAQLAEGPGAIVDSQNIESRFHKSSNPSRTCRFCGREFPSGRALGGHMRVHGALLFADTSSYMVEQEQRNVHGELETLGSADDMDFHLSRRRQIEEMKPSSFTSSSNTSHINSSERPNQTIKLDRHGQELDDKREEEQDERKGEKVTRMVDSSSFECTNLVTSKPGEWLGYGDASSELLTSKRKSVSALYELRRNPKPNQRFFRDQEHRGLSNVFWHTSSANGGTARSRSRSPSPEHERACSECGKVFLSWKALFGHMRCHPERDWRGIQPPDQQQLDRTTHKLIIPRASYAEISVTENTTNCELAGSALSHVDNKGKPTAKLQQDASSKNKAADALAAVVVARKETESSLTQKGGVVDIALRQFRGAATGKDQGDDKFTKGSASKKAEKNINTLKRSLAEHADHKEATAPWTLSWCTRKRSKRNWSAHSHHDLNWTSETTSNELRLSHHDAQLDVQEELDMANCLVLLSNAGDNIQELDRMYHDRSEGPASSHHVKKRGDLSKGIYSQRGSRAGMGAIQARLEVDEHEDDTIDDDNASDEVENKAATFYVGKEVKRHGSFNAEVKYQCSTCKKCFNSHQALGGHRASHKKMKGCFAQTKKFIREAQESSEESDDFDVNQRIRWQAMSQGEEQQEEEMKASPKKKIKGHECSICHRIFTSGQALGGHKRCHWNGERYVADSTASVASSNNKQLSVEERTEWGSKSTKTIAKEDVIDLNLPAPLDEDEEATFDLHIMPTEGADHGRMLPKAAKEEEAAASSVMGESGAASGRKQEDDWIVKDLWGGGPRSSFFHDMEVRCRLDRRPPMWHQRSRDNGVSMQISQVCPLKTI